MRCVCGHIRSLHRGGACMARVNPCGCVEFETEEMADKGHCFGGAPTMYHGRYGRK